MIVPIRLTGVLICALLIASCGLLPGNSSPEVEYQNAKRGSNLELPPELGGGQQVAQVQIPAGSDCAPCAIEPVDPKEVLLPDLRSARMVRNGAVSWLALDVSAERAWAGLGAFMQAQGFTVASESTRTGIMQTDWIDNSRTIASPALDALLVENIPPQSIGLHRFSFRLERDGDDSSRLFVRHEGVVSTVSTPDLTLNDPELASRLMLDLLVFFGVDSARSERIISGS